MEIFKMWGSIFLKDEEAVKGLDNIDNKGKTVGQRLKSIGKSAIKAGAIIGTAAIAAGGAMFGLAKRTANAGDEIQKMALRTGLSTEAVSELKHAAELSGTSIEAMETGVKRMQKVLFDAEKGLSTSNDALTALGMGFEDLQGLAPEEQFNKLSGALADIEDPSRRAALAQEVFGRAGTQMLPMLAEGSEGLARMRQEAHDLGIVFDQEAADKAAQFNDDLLRLKKGFTGIVQELAMKLIPVFVDQLFPVIVNRVIPAVQSFIEIVRNTIGWIRDFASRSRESTSEFSEVFMEAFGAVREFLSAFIDWAVRTWDEYGEDITRIIKTAWNTISSVIRVALKIITGIFNVFSALFRGDWEGLWKGVVKLVGTIFRGAYTVVKNIIKLIINVVRGLARGVRNAVSGVFKAITSPFRMAANTIGGIMDKAKSALNKLNPFARSSPSLVQLVEKGTEKIQEAYSDLGDMNLKPVAHQATETVRKEEKLITIDFRGREDVSKREYLEAFKEALKNPLIQRELDIQQSRNRRINFAPQGASV